jgi:predicted nucleic acid-binding protein
MILMLDNTVLTNFALVNKLELLPRALGSRVATTSQVISEYKEGVAKGLLPGVDWDWLEIVDLELEEQALFQQHLERVNAGEAACLAVAARRNGRILTDDRDARKLAAQLKVPVSGTLGILLRLVQIEALTLPEANRILGEMIHKEYRSPVDKLDDL